MSLKNKLLVLLALSGVIFLLFTGSASAAMDFPADEAGICAYVKAKSSIPNLNVAVPAFATIERQTDDYIIGTVAMSGHTEEQYPHVYVHKEGWVVAYYPRDRSSGWLLRYTPGPISTTTLKDAVQIVSDQIGGITTGLKYYDFRHPDATKMMIIGESTGSYNWFKVTIPSAFTTYRVDWSNYGTANLDEVRFSSVGGWAYGSFNPAIDFQNGIEHKLEVWDYKGNGRLALVIEYAE